VPASSYQLSRDKTTLTDALARWSAGSSSTPPRWSMPSACWPIRWCCRWRWGNCGIWF